MIPDPSAACLPSPSQARVKIVGNMIEFIRPMASRLYPEIAPLVWVESKISRIAPTATAASTLPGLTMRSKADPMKRPTMAPPQ